MNVGTASDARLSVVWCAVLGQIEAMVPAKRKVTERWMWPQRTRSICGLRATISARISLPSNPCWFIRPMKVGNGG